MKRNSFFPTDINGQSAWFTNYANQMKAIGALIGRTPAQILSSVADCLWLVYLLQEWLPATRKFSTTATKTVTDAQTGTNPNVMVLPAFVAPALPGDASPVAPGALNRIFAEVADIKNSGKCSDANANLLGIVGTAQPGPDLTTLQSVLSLVIINGQVLVKWTWGGYVAFLSSCEIWVDRGDGKGFVFLTIDTTPGYTDTQAFPAALTKWIYKAIYHMDEQQAGLWSQPVSITVPA